MPKINLLQGSVYHISYGTVTSTKVPAIYAMSYQATRLFSPMPQFKKDLIKMSDTPLYTLKVNLGHSQKYHNSAF